MRTWEVPHAIEPATEPMSQPILEVTDLRVAYGKAEALYGVSFTVLPGEVVALLGSNGAGKSTTLRAISGILESASGDICFAGRSIVRRRAHEILRAGISHCPEERHVWPEMSVEENLILGAYLLRDAGEMCIRMDKAFERFPRLLERRRQMAGTLSGGEQQMLAIARALMSEPRLLLLDEPSLGLSPLLVHEVMQTIEQLREHGVAVLLVEQNVHNALSVASRAYVLETGRVVACDTADALLANESLLRAYLGG